MKKIFPHIVGLGASHAGFGLVCELLAEHPSISSSLPPRNFFNTDAFIKHGRAWYEEELLVGSKKGQLVGDCTPGYLGAPIVAERIAATYPDAKLFVVIRHPVRRALAEFIGHTKTDRRAKNLGAARYLAEHPGIQTRSLYGQGLEPFFAYYSPLTLYIVIYEELIADPIGVMSKLYEFYGVDKNFVPKRLRPWLPPPDEPKHPSLIYKGKRLIRRVYKKLTYRPPVPLWPAEIVISEFLSPAEAEPYTNLFVADGTHLTNLMNRDMVAYWDLVQNSEPS